MDIKAEISAQTGFETSNIIIVDVSGSITYVSNPAASSTVEDQLIWSPDVLLMKPKYFITFKVKNGDTVSSNLAISLEPT